MKNLLREGRSENEFYREHYLRLYNLSYAILKNRMQAEEVMHDTLLKFFELWEKYGHIEDASKWLARVCTNRSIDQLRRNKAEKTEYHYNLEELLEIKDKENIITQERESSKSNKDEYRVAQLEFSKKEIGKAILSLAPGYRLVITLIHFEGFDYEEIAQITGLKEPTIRSQHLRAKRALAERLIKSKRRFEKCVNM